MKFTFSCLFELPFLEFYIKCFIAQNDPNDGKRKCEALWPIFKISHQKSRYVFDLYHKRNEISKELYEFCLEQGHADRNLIAKWKKVCQENLGLTFCVSLFLLSIHLDETIAGCKFLITPMLPAKCSKFKF